MKVFGIASLCIMTDIALCVSQIGRRQDFFSFCHVDGSEEVAGAPVAFVTETPAVAPATGEPVVETAAVEGTDAPAESSVETAAVEGTDAPAEGSVETAAVEGTDAPAETPVEAAAETPVEAAAETPVEAAAETTKDSGPDTVVGVTKMGNDCCCIERYPQSFPIPISK